METNFSNLAAAKLLGIDLPPTNDKRIRVRVTSRSHGQVVCGTFVEHGTHEYTIFEAHLDAWERLVETASAPERETAQRHYEKDVRDADARKAGKDVEYRRQYEPSYPAAFRNLYGRDLLPFDRVDLVEDKPAAKR